VDGEFCALADDAAGFAEKAIRLLEDSKLAAEMARRARAEVVENWDMAVITRRLVGKYREIVKAKAHNT
jgi:glycosyltransferase involved in cell wall biosynthesis